MLARIRSGALLGVDALLVMVEVDVSPGLPQTSTVGLPDGAVREGRDRIRAALRNSGFEHPQRAQPWCVALPHRGSDRAAHIVGE